MQSPSWYLHRLRSMSPAEVLWRVRRMLSANLDLLRIPAGFYPRLRVQPEHRAPAFRLSADDGRYAAEQGDAPFDAWSRRLRRQADAICENRLSFFDLEDCFLGDPVDWHRDFSAGRAAPRGLSDLIDYRDFENSGDCKLVWEPNRHHQLVVLGRAWRATGELRYAEKAVELWDSWLDANPFGYGMNWKSPLEIGIRLINWAWAYDLLRDAPFADDGRLDRLLEATWLSAWEVQRKYSRGSSANNHLIGEAAGVYIACSYFAAMPNASRWRDEAADILEREILAQSFADGCTREHAFGYQFFVIQFFTLCLLAGEGGQRPFSRAYRERLHALYRFLAQLSADTGRPPNAGDADDGYVLDLGERPASARELLSVGACLFDDDELALAAASESAYWLLGTTGPGTAAPAPRTSRAWKESGYFLLRAGGAGGRPPVRVFFDCAELGFGQIAAHGHADCLAFTLAVDGEELLVDPGTYDYFTYPEWRNYFRSTAAHNTLGVDGRDQSESLGPFLWGRRAEARLLDWQETEDAVIVAGEHDGYRRLPDPVTHRRELTLASDGSHVEILDTVLAAGAHELRLCFHVADGCEVLEAGNGAVSVTHGRTVLALRCAEGTLELVRAREGRPTGWISPGYHRKRPGTCIAWNIRHSGQAAIRTRIDISRTDEE